MAVLLLVTGLRFFTKVKELNEFILKTLLACLGRQIKVEDIDRRLLGPFASSVLSLPTIVLGLGGRPFGRCWGHEVCLLC